MLFSGYRMREYKRLHPLQDGTTDGHMSHAAEQGPRCSFQYRIRKYKRLRPLQSGADRREHVTCGKTRLPMLFSRRYRIVRIQEITPFTRRHDGREHVAYNRARHIVLYTKNTIGDMKAEFSKSPHLYRSQHRRKPNKAKQSQTKPNKAKQKHESGVFRRKHPDSCLLESKRNAYLYPKPFEAA